MVESQTLWPEGGYPIHLEYSTTANGMVAVVKITHGKETGPVVDKRVWQGETAHMDGRRFYDDAILAVTYGHDIPSA